MITPIHGEDCKPRVLINLDELLFQQEFESTPIKNKILNIVNNNPPLQSTKPPKQLIDRIRQAGAGDVFLKEQLHEAANDCVSQFGPLTEFDEQQLIREYKEAFLQATMDEIVPKRNVTTTTPEMMA